MFTRMRSIPDSNNQRRTASPVEVESCNLSIVSLKVDKIEEVLGRLLMPLLSEIKKERFYQLHHL